MICFRNPHLKTLYKYWKKLFASTQKFKKRTWTVEEVFSLSVGVMQMSFDTGELFKYTFILKHYPHAIQELKIPAGLNLLFR